MHLLVRETRTLDDDGAATDLGQTPADIVLLSFSDSDLGAAAVAWQGMGARRPTLRLANLARLRHPMSVDLYMDSVIARARCVVVRLLGGLEYWPYGVEQVAAVCRDQNIALAIVPGDVRDDSRLTAASTLPAETVACFDRYLSQGGPDNCANALWLAAECAGLPGPPPAPPRPTPPGGEFLLAEPPDGRHGGAAIVFYRSHFLAGDIAPVTALAVALSARGLGVRALYASSLKDPVAAAFVADRLRAWHPAVVLNCTGFSARQADGSPLDVAGVPVLQAVLANAARADWAASSRGLTQTDLAMQVVLPELDGRLLTGAISFKAEAETVAGLEFSRTVHMPDDDGIALAAERALGWARLAQTRPEARLVAMILSDYPGTGGGQIGHAVGLDTFASANEILRLLGGAGYRVGDLADLARAELAQAEPVATITLASYTRLFSQLPENLRRSVTECWGDPAQDPAMAAGTFWVRHVVAGNVVAAVQPERGFRLDRKSGYHDPDLPPRHSYIAFYLWLRDCGLHALIHLGTHGTLEWLPGKATALSAACCPAALIGGLPVIYPFIVNNPGEAAVAKRRLGAVTIGHLTPPLTRAGSHGAAGDLERLLDDYAAADGLDRRRTALLRSDILERAGATGLLAESGVAPGADGDEALARLDAYLCDLKTFLIRDGLHVFGRAPSPALRATALQSLQDSCSGVSADTLAASLDQSAPAEAAALLAALDGRFVAPGPAGAATRGRADVLPTGRNLFTVDPRGVPTASALRLAELAASELLRRHRQDTGDWPRALVIDLWGTTTLRTGGEDLALALVLLGARPVWDDGSGRVSGFEVLPIALLDRPRVDVTLRISGLFRDVFPAQIQLFDAAVRAVAARDEDDSWNPLAVTRHLDAAAQRRATLRVFGTAPSDYGSGVSERLARGAWDERTELGAAYVAASSHAYGLGVEGVADIGAFSARIAGADGFVHAQDHREIDLLEGVEHAAHLGGFASAAQALGVSPAVYHLDISDPHAPRARTAGEEVVRVVRARAVNPRWISGMMRHGYRGAAEMLRTLQGLHAFAATLPSRFDAQFELLFDATLGDVEIDTFLRAQNPAAHHAMLALFQDAQGRGLWHARRNDLAACG